MKWSFQFGSIKGIPVKVHLTFFLVLLWGAFHYGGRNDLSGLLYGAGITLLLFGIVFLHELGHSAAARYFGIGVSDITLLPIGGVARLEKMPEKPIREFVIAIAGPAVNVVIALILLPILVWATDASIYRMIYVNLNVMSWLNVLKFLFLVNLSLLIFNMIPAFPLDGGRVLRSLMAMVMGTGRATKWAVRVGQAFAILMGIYGISTGNIMLALISVFIFTVGGAEGRVAIIRGVLDNVTARQIISPGGVVLQPNYGVMEVASLIMHNAQHKFPVMLGDSLIGVLRRQDIRRALQEGNRFATVAEIMIHEFPRLDIDLSLTEVQEKLLRSGSPVAAMFDGLHYVGLIGFEDIENAYHLYSAKRRTSPLPV